MLYESAPLQSKPVKKKKSRFDAPSLSSLWEDEHSLSKKKAAAVKLEQELEYIEEYFLPYSKEADSHGIDIFAMSHGKIRERPHYSEDSSATIIESSMGDSCAASVRSSRPKNDSLPPRSQSSNAASVLSPNSENHTPHSQVEILQRSVREIEISGNRKSGLDGRSSRLE